MDRRFVLFLAASVVFMPAVLWLERDGWPTQIALGVAMAAFVWLFARRSAVNGRQVLCAIAVASLAEVVLSLGWGLYSYRHALIPLYVPPGHGLFYALAAATAQQPRLRRHAPAITGAVLTAGSALALANLLVLDDTWGAVWWVLSLALILGSRNRLLLSSCVVYTMLLEWAGTAIGNWRWAAEVPFVGLHSANPPSGVGILYVLLDLIVVTLAAGIGAARAGREADQYRPRNRRFIEAFRIGFTQL